MTPDPEPEPTGPYTLTVIRGNTSTTIHKDITVNLYHNGVNVHELYDDDVRYFDNFSYTYDDLIPGDTYRVGILHTTCLYQANAGTEPTTNEPQYTQWDFIPTGDVTIDIGGTFVNSTKEGGEDDSEDIKY